MQRLRVIALVCALGFAGAIPARAPAQAGGSYSLERAAIASGGTTLSGGTFRMSSTIGQPATATLGSANYQLYDGFWAPIAAPTSDLIFANGFDP